MEEDPATTYTLILILALIMTNAFFAATEIALVSVRRTRIRQLADEGNARARTVQRLLENPTNFMSTIQIGVTLVGFLAAAAAAVNLAQPLAVVIDDIPVAIIANNALPIAVFLVTIVVGFVTLVAGEIGPKSLAMQHAEKIALWTAGTISLLSYIFLPAVKVISFFSNLLVRPFGGRATFAAPILTEEELKMLVEAGEEAGTLEEEEKEMIHSIFEFTDTVTRQVMVPRIDMKSAEVTASLDELLEVILKHGHSRIPVYEDNVDQIIGVVHAKDLLPVLKEDLRDFDVRRVMRPAYFIPENKPVDELLAEFKRSKIQMAIVRDEYGGTAGLVTIEDLLEEIVGDIMDEYDVEELMIDVIDENTAVVNARMSIDDLNEHMNLSLPESDEYETLGGFVFGLIGTQPNEGDSVTYENVAFSVEKTEGGRLHKIRVVRTPLPEPPSNNRSGNNNVNGGKKERREAGHS